MIMRDTVSNSLGEEIEITINSKIANIPYPVKCEITRVYSDNRVDVDTDLGNLSYVECIGNNLSVGNVGILLFLNGKDDEYIVITN